MAIPPVLMIPHLRVKGDEVVDMVSSFDDRATGEQGAESRCGILYYIVGSAH